MSKATWLLIVNIFADVCILVYPYTGEQSEFFKEFEKLGLIVHNHRLNNNESESIKFEDLENELRTRIPEPPRPPDPPDELTDNQNAVCFGRNGREDSKVQNIRKQKENLEAVSVFSELSGLQFPGDAYTEEKMKLQANEPFGLGLEPVEAENMQGTGLEPLSGDKAQGLDGGQVSDEGQDPGGGVIEQSSGKGSSMGGAYLPDLDQSWGQALLSQDFSSGWSISEAPPSPGWWLEGNTGQGMVQSSGASQGLYESGPVGYQLRNKDAGSDLGQTTSSNADGGRVQGEATTPNSTNEQQRLQEQRSKYGVYGTNTRRVYDFMPHPTQIPSAVARQGDERLFKHGQSLEDMTDLDSPEDLLKYLPQSTTKYPVAFDENMQEYQVPENKDGKVPGVGSESEYPNGFRINYGNLNKVNRGSALGFGKFGTNQLPTGSYPETVEKFPGPVLGKPTALRQGFPSMYDNRYTASQKNALRMGELGSPKLDAKGGFQPDIVVSLPGYVLKGQHRGIVRGSPPGYMQGGQRVGMGEGPAAEYTKGKQPPGMEGGFVSEYMQMGQQLGIGGSPPPGYMQGGQRVGMGEGPAVEYTKGKQPPGMEGGFVSEYMQMGQQLGIGGSPPPGYMQGGQRVGMGEGPAVEYTKGKQPPGLEGGFVSEYMQMGQPPGMGGSPPPGYKQEELPLGMGGGPPPGYKQGGLPRMMEGGSLLEYIQIVQPLRIREDPPPGYKQEELRPRMGGDLPPGYMQMGQPPGMRGGPPPGYKQGELPPKMGGDLPPRYMQMGQPPGMGGGPPPRYKQGELPPGIGGGPPPEYMQMGQPPGIGEAFPPGY